MDIIEAKNISKIYRNHFLEVKALRGISFKVKKSEILGIMGKSGSGKSTLLNILGGLDVLDSGEYYFKGRKIDFSKQRKLADFRRKNIGMILQQFALIEDMNIYENVSLPLKYSFMKNKEIKKKVENLLENLEIADKMSRHPAELSGGERQRVAIARALINDPEVILADEPTGALDSETEKVILDILKDLNKSGKTIIIVTHDREVASICSRILTLKDGQIVA